jgi:hypothetical protein
MRSADIVRAYLREVGRMGGASKSPEKIRAAKQNIQRAREAKLPPEPPRGVPPVPKLGEVK